MVVVVSVAALVFAASLAYEIVVRSGWTAPELGYTPAEDGFYQLAWNSEGNLRLAYLGAYGPYYALLYGERTDGEWSITSLSQLTYEHDGASLALDSQGKAYVCTHAYDPVPFMNLGPHIVFATNAGGEWETEVINTTGYCTASEVALDAEDRAHLIYSQDSYQSTVDPNSSIVDMTWSPEGWTNTTLKETHLSYRVFNIQDVDRRPDGSIGMIYTTYDLASWSDVLSHRLNYTVISGGELIVDYTIVPSLDNYTGVKSLCHDSAGNAHVGAYVKNDDNYSLCYLTNAGGEWTETSIAYGGNTKWFGTGTGITVGSDGSIHVGYFVQDYDGVVANHTVRYCTNADGSWKVRILDDCQGWYMKESIAVAIDEDRICTSSTTSWRTSRMTDKQR